MFGGGGGWVVIFCFLLLIQPHWVVVYVGRGHFCKSVVRALSFQPFPLDLGG